MIVAQTSLLPGRDAVAVGEGRAVLGGGLHRVDEVVGGRAALERGVEAGAGHEVAGHDLDARERLDALRIAVSEVVSNAVRHGSVQEQTIGIDLAVRPDFIRVTVTQEEPAFRRPASPTPSPSGEGGFGR